MFIFGIRFSYFTSDLRSRTLSPLSMDVKINKLWSFEDFWRQVLNGDNLLWFKDTFIQNKAWLEPDKNQV